jgi:hypothetical protein
MRRELCKERVAQSIGGWKAVLAEKLVVVLLLDLKRMLETSWSESSDQKAPPWSIVGTARSDQA